MANNDMHESTENGYVSNDLINVINQLSIEYQKIEPYINFFCCGVNDGIESWQGPAQNSIAAALCSLEREERKVCDKTYAYIQLLSEFHVQSIQWDINNVNNISVEAINNGGM